MIVKRNFKGNLEFNHVEFEDFILELFEQCYNEREINFLKNNMIDCIEALTEQWMEEIE